MEKETFAVFIDLWSVVVQTCQLQNTNWSTGSFIKINFVFLNSYAYLLLGQMSTEPLGVSASLTTVCTENHVQSLTITEAIFHDDKRDKRKKNSETV